MAMIDTERYAQELSKLRETQNNYEFLRQVQQTTPAGLEAEAPTGEM